MKTGIPCNIAHLWHWGLPQSILVLQCLHSSSNSDYLLLTNLAIKEKGCGKHRSQALVRLCAPDFVNKLFLLHPRS